MNVICITNIAAGVRAHSPEALRDRLERQGIVAEMRPVSGDRIAATAKEAAGNVDAIVAAGGDGTINACASVLAGTDVPLGILPVGTLNHFAKDLHIPLLLDDAIAVIAAGQARRVDVGQVNGRFFVNNSSIGLYPRMIGRRDEQRQRLGRGKWLAMLLASISVFRRYPTVRVRMHVGGESVVNTTPFVFVGNNRYELTLTNLGRRSRLDGEELCLYFTQRTGRFGFLRLALRAALGLLEQTRDFQTLHVREVWIETPRRDLPVALDGEVVRLSPPLHYQVNPKALMVLAPGGDVNR